MSSSLSRTRWRRRLLRELLFFQSARFKSLFLIWKEALLFLPSPSPKHNQPTILPPCAFPKLRGRSSRRGRFLSRLRADTMFCFRDLPEPEKQCSRKPSLLFFPLPRFPKLLRLPKFTARTDLTSKLPAFLIVRFGLPITARLLFPLSEGGRSHVPGKSASLIADFFFLTRLRNFAETFLRDCDNLLRAERFISRARKNPFLFPRDLCWLSP